MRALAKLRDVVSRIELGEQFLRGDDERSQGVRGEHNLAMSAGWSKKNVAAPQLKLWWLFSEIASVVHAPVSRLRSEQRDTRSLTFDRVESYLRPVSGRPS